MSAWDSVRFGYDAARRHAAQRRSQSGYTPMIRGQRDCMVPDCDSHEARLYPGGNLCDPHKPGPQPRQERKAEPELEAA